ncbi:MAG: cytochrome c biogenesis protein CcdA [Chloroflexi bacterium]|nr:MAG: cytochrome c biogenesis protein CcdA [Chloroflexota bacterium]
MTLSAFAFAFSAGMLATINPCGFAMLPAFISFYLADEGQEPAELSTRLLKALRLGLLTTAGFLVVFVISGVILSAAGQLLNSVVPWFGVVIGVGLVLLGIWTLLGRNIGMAIPIPSWDLRTQSPISMFLYGVAYALVSLSCTLPIFLSVFASAMAATDLGSALGLFVAYSGGMGIVIITLALATALFQTTVHQYMRSVMPYVKTLSAGALIVAGAFLVIYQVALNPLGFAVAGS